MNRLSWPREAHLWRITLLTGLLAALMGLLLRLSLAQPMAFNFRFLLHGHSHAMLLGWLLPALLLLVYRQWGRTLPRSSAWLLLLMALCVGGMMISFPLQGYAAISISFSTLHILLSYFLMFFWWRHSKGRWLSGGLVRLGVIFFVLASLGPFSLGPLMVLEMQDSPWYQQAIYFYLHFLYGGAYICWALAVMTAGWLKRNSVPRRRSAWLLLLGLGISLAWFHKLAFNFNGWWINALGGVGAVLQLLALLLLLRHFRWGNLSRQQVMLLMILVLQWLFQIAAAWPSLAHLAIANRPVLVAFLHFIFLGFFTPFIWVNIARPKQLSTRWLSLYGIGFALSEALLITGGLLPLSWQIHLPWFTFAAYGLVITAWLVFTIRSWQPCGMALPARGD